MCRNGGTLAACALAEFAAYVPAYVSETKQAANVGLTSYAFVHLEVLVHQWRGAGCPCFN